MENNLSIPSFLGTQNVDVPIGGFVINLAMAIVLATVLGEIYVRFGTALSNRRMFARNLTTLALTTALVITIVKSSLALSLGLVGALSIVRFRAAIKEPEELTYLFLAIGIGLGLGANQRELTLVAMAIIMAFLVIRSRWRVREEYQNLHLTVSSNDPEKVKLQNIVDALRSKANNIELKRFDQADNVIEASFLVEFEDFEQLEQTRATVEELGESIVISFVDNKGIS